MACLPLSPVQPPGDHLSQHLPPHSSPLADVHTGPEADQFPGWPLNRANEDIRARLVEQGGRGQEGQGRQRAPPTLASHCGLWSRIPLQDASLRHGNSPLCLALHWNSSCEAAKRKQPGRAGCQGLPSSPPIPMCLCLGPSLCQQCHLRTCAP